MPIVERCLPPSNPSVRAQVWLVNSTTKNAYDLLWKLASALVPVFDVTQPIVLPTFENCIFRFATHYNLHN